MLYAKTYVDSAAFQVVLGQTEVPRSHLEDMKQVIWHIFILDGLVHDITQWPHL